MRPIASGGVCPLSDGGMNEVLLSDSVTKLLSFMTRPRKPRTEYVEVIFVD